MGLFAKIKAGVLGLALACGLAAPAQAQFTFGLTPNSLQLFGPKSAAAAQPINAIVGPTNTLGPSSANFCGTQVTGCLEGAFATWASGTPSVPNPDGGSPLTFSITEKGYVLTPGVGANVATTTYTDTVYLTSRVRQAFPNQASLHSSLVSLSRDIYDPSVDTLPAGITNNSTVLPFKPICGWPITQKLVIGNTIGAGSIPIEVACAHARFRAGEQIAGVVFTLTDQHSHSWSYTVRDSDCSASSITNYCQLVYAIPAGTDISGAGFTSGDQITVSAQAYPWVGLAAQVASTADSAVAREFSPRYFLYNPTAYASPVHAYVCTTSGQGSCTANGNDSTGVWTDVDATAKSLPFATQAGAFNAIDAARNTAKTNSFADGLVLYIGSGGPYTVGGSAVGRKQAMAAITITRDPAVSRANAQINTTGSWTPKLNTSNASPDGAAAIRIYDLTLIRGANAAISGTTIRLQIYLDNINFDNGSSANGTMLTTSDLYLNTVTLLNSNVGGSTFSPSANGEIRLARGMTGAMSQNPLEEWLDLGNNLTGVSKLDPGTRTADRSIVAFNGFYGFNATSDFYNLGGGEDIPHGAVLMQNVVEAISSTSARVGVAMSRDAQTGSVSNFLEIENTFTGFNFANRNNQAYDDCRTGLCTATRFTKSSTLYGTIFSNLYVKGDVFVGTVAQGPGIDVVNAPNRTGHFQFIYAVNHAGNIQQFVDVANGGIGGDRHQAYTGRRSLFGSNDTVPRMAFSFYTAYAGPTLDDGAHDGAGGGTYSLTTGAPAIGIVPVAPLKKDLAGNTRKLTGDTAGALCFATAGACN